MHCRRRYHDAIAVNPHYSRAHFNLANVYRERGEWDKALQSYERALQTQSAVQGAAGAGAAAGAAAAAADADIPPHLAQLNAGVARAMLGQAEGALADFDAVIAQQPRSVSAWINRARLHCTLRNWKLAEARLAFSLRVFKQILRAKTALALPRPHCGSHCRPRTAT